MDGVAFFEAKLAKFDSIDSIKRNFDAVRKEQLERLKVRSENHRLVLYDVSSKHQGVALSIPTAHACSLSKINEKMYGFCELWAYTLTNRIFRGYELNYDKEVVDVVKKSASKFGGVDYMMVCVISSVQEPKQQLDLFLGELDLDGMYRIEGEYPDLDHSDIGYRGPRP
ncbi:hypothetical protein ACET9B_19880 [Aeromonas veronii]